MQDRKTWDTGSQRSTDVGKAQFSLLDPIMLEEVSAVLAFGADKYGRDNWRKGQTYNRCIDSTLRHILQFARGEDRDKETGLLVLAHAICSLMFLIFYERMGMKSLDDRYFPVVSNALPSQQSQPLSLTCVYGDCHQRFSPRPHSHDMSSD